MINESIYYQKYQIIKKEIMRDIELEDLEIIRKDPIGNAFYVYYLLKNDERGYELDGLISLMNEWVEEILVKEKTTRSIDVDITSAFFTYGVLKKYNKLKKIITTKKLNDFFTKYISNEGFFNNYLLSVIIAIGVNSFKEDIIDYGKLSNWIKSNYKKHVSVNDSKTILYTYTLFRLLKESENNKEIIQSSLKSVINREILYDDEICYSYILWSERESIKNRSEYQIVRSFVSNTLKNMKGVIKEDENNISKLKKGLYLDLFNLFNSDTITVSKKELERKDVPRIIFVLPIISMASFLFSCYMFSNIISGALYIQINSLFLISEDLLVKISLDSGAIIIGAIIMITSVSIFYDIVISRITNLKLVRENLIKRIGKLTGLSLVGVIIQGIQTWKILSNN